MLIKSERQNFIIQSFIIKTIDDYDDYTERKAKGMKRVFILILYLTLEQTDITETTG